MAHWHLTVLGPPTATYGERRIDRLGRRIMWAILASIALDPVPPTRAILAKRFWTKNESHNLGNVLSLLVKEFTPEIINKDLRLVPGTTCDLLEIRRLVKRARELSDARDRRVPLQEAVLFLNGLFLDQHEEEAGGDWIRQTCQIVYRESGDLLEMLLTCQRELGDEAAASETFQRLVNLDPARAKKYEFPTPTVTQAERPKKKKAHAHPLQQQIDKTPQVYQPALYALSIFTGDFTREQALSIAVVGTSELSHFTSVGLVQATAQERFILPPYVQETLWRKQTGEKRRRLRQKLAEWFIKRTEQLCVPMPRGEDLPFLVAQARQLEVALDYILGLPPTREGALFVTHLWEFCSPLKQRLLGTESYLEQYLEAPSTDFISAMQVLMILLSIQQKKHSYNANSRHWAQRCQSLCDSSEEDIVASGFQHLLIYYHNVGDDTQVDFLLEQISEYYKKKGWQISPGLSYNIAENLMARGKGVEALPYAERFLQYAAKEGSMSHRAAAHFQNGAIYRLNGDWDMARQHWNDALLLFENLSEKHGVGQCLEALARLYRESGMLGEAQRSIRQAIELFQECNDPAAVTAARGTFGDILLDLGEWDRAKAYYEEGLAFWQERGHPRWTEKFQKRLRNLPAPL